MNWLEVSLTVNGELAESVADVLARFAPNGVVMEQSVQFINDVDPGTPAGPITVRAYLEVDDQLEGNRQKLEESLHYLGMIRPLPAPSYKSIADQNWMEAWKQHYRPILIGKRLLVLPAWMQNPDPMRIPIRINPGMAFGTGTHPSTQLCLELIERYFDDRLQRFGPPASSMVDRPLAVIDVGCGSGILSIAALKLGARHCLGVDTDIESVKNAGENAALNVIGEELILGHGSVPEILQGDYAFNQAPLVVANILAPVIIQMLEAGLGDLVESDGELILGGILDPQMESVVQAARVKGFHPRGSRQVGDWAALSMER
ncbi:MAG: 50S ribosomal protein L11 methyltransferase [Chloroflexi bacterium]|nr:50S ribosomal protein L11 methyltransferase [Chloroflexota bacterium]